MKTKTILTAGCLILATVCTQAQQTTEPKREKAIVETQGDSIIILRGKGDMRIRLYEQQIEDDEQKEVEIFEGVYLEKVDADSRTFLDALPFIPKKKKYNEYEAHVSGVFLGFSRLADNFMGFGSSSKAHLDLSQSWEFGFNLLAASHNFKKNPHWGVNIGLSWGYRSFSFDGELALLKQDGSSYFQNGQEMQPEGSETTTPYYSDSRLRHFFFRIPVQLEWQQRWNKSLVFFNFGPEFEIRHGAKSFSHVNGGKKQTVGKGMYVRPIGTNLLLQAGYGNLGVYLRYSMNTLFQDNKGPDVSPYSFGIAWYW